MQIINNEVKLRTSFTFLLIFVISITLNIHVASESNMVKNRYSASSLKKKSHLSISNQFDNNNNNPHKINSNSNSIEAQINKSSLTSDSSSKNLLTRKETHLSLENNNNKKPNLKSKSNIDLNFISQNETITNETSKNETDKKETKTNENNKNKTNKKETKTKKTSFPNSHKALTSSKYFNSTNFTAPKLSNALSGNNPKTFLTKEKFLQLVKGANYHLTRGEMEQIFVTLDTKKEDRISVQQFENFKTLFILPFEACDSTNSYLLSEADFIACLKADPKSHFVDFRHRQAQDLYQKLSGIVSSRRDQKLNFFAYLFVKRALYAWTQCQSHHKYISVSSFKCAMEIMTQLHNKILYEDLYKIALEYQFNDGALIAPDFICFLSIAYKAFFFNSISYPNRNYLLEKSLFLKAIGEDRLPQNFKHSEVNLFYDLIDVRKSKGEAYQDNLGKTRVGAKEAGVAMDFHTFMFFFHYHILMNKYSVAKPQQLTKAEVMRLLEDRSVPAKILNVIDHSLTLLEERQHLEASLIHGAKRPNEAQFFTKFLMVGNETEKEESSVDQISSMENVSDIDRKGMMYNKYDKNGKYDKEERGTDVEMGDEFDTKDSFDATYDDLIEKENEDYGEEDEKEKDPQLEKKLIENLFLIEKVETASTRLTFTNSKKSAEQSNSKRHTRNFYRRRNHSLSTSSLYIKNTTNSSYYNIQKNEKNREIFFTIFSRTNKGIWSQKDFFRAFQIANLFTYFIDVDQNWRVPVKKIAGKILEAYRDVTPNINNLHWETNKIYPSLPVEMKIDFLAFAAIENFFEKAKSFNSAEDGKINEIDLKVIMKDCGLLEIHDPVLDLASKGFDKLGRRVFDLRIIAEKIFVNQVAAAELKSDELLFKNNGLKKNEDSSRKFPQNPRRHAPSPFV